MGLIRRRDRILTSLVDGWCIALMFPYACAPLFSAFCADAAVLAFSAEAMSYRPMSLTVRVMVQVVSAAAWEGWTGHVIRRQASAAARATTRAQTVTSVQQAITATRHATVRNCSTQELAQ